MRFLSCRRRRRVLRGLSRWKGLWVALCVEASGWIGWGLGFTYVRWRFSSGILTLLALRRGGFALPRDVAHTAAAAAKIRKKGPVQSPVPGRQDRGRARVRARVRRGEKGSAVGDEGTRQGPWPRTPGVDSRPPLSWSEPGAGRLAHSLTGVWTKGGGMTLVQRVSITAHSARLSGMRVRAPASPPARPP